MLPIKLPYLLDIVPAKFILRGNTHPCWGPHIPDINVLLSVIIEIEPAHAHSCTGLFDVCLARNRPECSISVVDVQIASPEIVGDIEIRPAIAGTVAPRAREAVAIILDVEACLLCSILKRGVSFIVQQKIWRTIACIKVRYRIAVLVQAHIVAV